jgi:hypothetical protein
VLLGGTDDGRQAKQVDEERSLRTLSDDLKFDWRVEAHEGSWKEQG